MRTSITLFVLSFVLVLTLSASVYADYELIGKIPAPQPGPYFGHVTGLASAGEYLFATVVSETTSYVCLIRPSDGMLMDSYAWAYSYFDAAAYQGSHIYWVADASGAYFRQFEFDDGSVNLLDTFQNHRITAPSGLAYQVMQESIYDALWVADGEVDSLFLVETTGDILGAYSLSDVAYYYGLNPTSVTRSGANLFFTSSTYTDSLFETTEMAGRVDAHLLRDLGQMDVNAATFHDGLLYVGGYDDSILIYSTGTYSDSVPAGDSVLVQVIPNELSVGFTHVGVAGSLYVEKFATQSCPPPSGVTFFSDFYDVSTTATFDYITKVALINEGEFPPGVTERLVRAFVRPSGECETWRDVTVAMIEEEDLRNPVLSRLSKRLSEDDEFSVFALGEDARRVKGVVALKFDYLDSAITRNSGAIPPTEYTQMSDLLDRARTAFANRSYEIAARRVDQIADLALNTPAIPHTYDPEGSPGSNVAGRIISRAHTLSFSLRLMIEEHQLGNPPGPSWKNPAINIIEDSPGRFAPMPNPSQSEFMISFTGSGMHPVSVKVYSVEGALVRTLAAGERLSGSQSVTWDGRNDQGLPVAAGTYFAVLEEGDQRSVRKMVLQK